MNGGGDKMSEKIRSENWTIALYPENEKDMSILSYIERNYKYAYIEHAYDVLEKDVIDEETGEILQKAGELKKPHIHVIFSHDNARTIDSIAKELNIEENRVQKVKSIKFMYRYLLHLDQPMKTPYEKEEIKTNCKELVDKYCKKDLEPMQIQEIYEYIYSKDKYIYYHEIIEFVLRKNYYATLRRGSNIVNKILEEHNRLFLEKRDSEKQKEMYIKKEIAQWEYENSHTKKKANKSTYQ